MSHWQSLTKRRGTDILWTVYIKTRDKGLCTVNFRCFKGSEGSDVSHYHGRRKETVRYDDENCDFVCRACHNFVHTALGAKIYDEWKLKQLGQKRFNLLLLRANLTGKRDDVIAKIIIKQKIKDLDELQRNPNYN